MSPKPLAGKGEAQGTEAPASGPADAPVPARKRAVRRAPATDGTVVAGAGRILVSDAKAVANLAAVADASGASVSQAEYWEDACAELMARDRIMRKLIPGHGTVRLESRGEPFTTLARSIVGQQISVKAAQTVWDRLQLACQDFAPASVLALPLDGLAACGLSRRKAEYIRDLASHFDAGTLHVTRWSEMDDEAVIGELTQIRGIGRWTAEMFLIFNQLRPNVLPLDDIGLLRAISLNYFSGEPVTRSEAREVASNWEPWRTVATWYLWRSLDPIPVEY